jgi:ABC-type metal ion transport system substrate-binding protein
VEDSEMEVRFEAIESDIATMKMDLAVIRSNYATKEELAIVRADVAVIRSNYVTREDLQRELNNLTWKIFGFASFLTAAVYYIARYVH